MGIIIRQSIKGSFVTFAGTFIGFLTSFFIVTRLPDGVYGLTQILLSISLVFTGLGQLGTTSSIVRYFPFFKNENKNNGFFFYVIVIPFMGLVLVTSILLFLQKPIEFIFSIESSLFFDYYYWLIPLTFFLVYWGVLESYSAVLMRIVIPQFIREFLVRIFLAIIFIAFIIGLVNLDSLIALYTCVYAVAMLLMLFYISRIGSISLKRDTTFDTKSIKKDFYSFTSFFILSSLGTSLIAKIDIIMVGSQIGLVETDIYAIALFIVAIIEIPNRSISAISSPIVAESLKKNDIDSTGQLYKKVALHQFLISSFIFLIIIINLDNIFQIMPNGAKFSKGLWVVILMGLTKLLHAVLGFGTSIINLSKYYKWMLYLSLFSATLTISLNLLLIPRYNLIGAAIATSISCCITYVIQQIILFKNLNITPFSLNIFKVIIIFGILFAVNFMLPSIFNPYIDCMYRTFIISILSFFIVYFSKISEDFNSLIQNRIKR